MGIKIYFFLNNAVLKNGCFDGERVAPGTCMKCNPGRPGYLQMDDWLTSQEDSLIGRQTQPRYCGTASGQLKNTLTTKITGFNTESA